MVGWIFIGVVVLLMYLYVRGISRSREHLESLHEPPQDMMRADDNQRPPYDGSAGWV